MSKEQIDKIKSKSVGKKRKIPKRIKRLLINSSVIVLATATIMATGKEINQKINVGEYTREIADVNNQATWNDGNTYGYNYDHIAKGLLEYNGNYDFATYFYSIYNNFGDNKESNMNSVLKITNNRETLSTNPDISLMKNFANLNDYVTTGLGFENIDSWDNAMFEKVYEMYQETLGEDYAR